MIYGPWKHSPTSKQYWRPSINDDPFSIWIIYKSIDFPYYYYSEAVVGKFWTAKKAMEETDKALKHKGHTLINDEDQLRKMKALL